MQLFVAAEVQLMAKRIWKDNGNFVNTSNDSEIAIHSFNIYAFLPISFSPSLTPLSLYINVMLVVAL